MKKNRIITLTLAATVFFAQVHAQNVGINADGSLPDPNAALDIKAIGKGLLIPRTSTSTRQTIPNIKGLLVYDTTTSSFWYNTGTAWQNMAAAPATGGTTGNWSLTGNSGTNNTNFLGTVDSIPFVVKVNNQLSGRIDADMRNTFWGYKAGNFNQSSIGQAARDSGNFPHNTAVGYSAMYSNITGRLNTAIGSGALYSVTDGLANTAIGTNALHSGNSGSNTATGYYAMYNNGTGGANAAYGTYSLMNNSTGVYNTATGHQAMIGNTTGQYNTASGMNALYGATTGNYNTSIGVSSGGFIVGGSSNTFIGAYAEAVGDYTNSTAIGAGAAVNASNKVRIGNSAVTVIEGQVPFTTPSDGRFKFQVQDDVKGLDFILKLRPVTYRFDVSRFDAQHGNPHEAKDATHTNYALQASYNEASLIRRSGFIAQEVEKAAQASGYDFSGIIAPKTEQEHYSLSYESFVVPLVKAVQEQQKTIDEQNKKIAGLQQQLDEIKQLLQHTK